MIKCITFDLDNTLWPCEEVILNAEQKAYEWFDMNCPNISKNLSKEEIREFLVSEAKKKPEYSHNWTFLRLNGYKNLLKNYNYSEKLLAHQRRAHSQLSHKYDRNQWGQSVQQSAVHQTPFGNYGTGVLFLKE